MKHLHKHFFSPSLGLLIIRIVAGSIFVFQGVTKLSNMEGTVAFFASLGFSAFLAWVVALIETIGGIAIILGYFSRFFSVLLAIIILVAIFKVKIGSGIQGAMADLTLLGMLVAILFSGCGRYSLCNWKHKGICDGCDKDCGCHPHA